MNDQQTSLIQASAILVAQVEFNGPRYGNSFVQGSFLSHLVFICLFLLLNVTIVVKFFFHFLLILDLIYIYRVSQKTWTFFENAITSSFIEETFPNFL